MDRQLGTSITAGYHLWFAASEGKMTDNVDLRAGFGVAAYPATATTVDDLLRAADAALYVAKRGGGNRVAAAPALPPAS